MNKDKTPIDLSRGSRASAGSSRASAGSSRPSAGSSRPSAGSSSKSGASRCQGPGKCNSKSAQESKKMCQSFEYDPNIKPHNSKCTWKFSSGKKKGKKKKGKKKKGKKK